MLALNGMKTVDLTDVELGHLVLLKTGLAIRALEPFPPELPQPPVNVLVFLEAGKPPLASPLQNIRRKCIDFGALEIRAPAEVGSFSPDTQYSRPGAVAIADDGTWIICQETDNNMDLWLQVSTGVVGPRRMDVWYVSRWSLGICDAEGEFRPLYSWS
jgi:hypothetical protein